MLNRVPHNKVFVSRELTLIIRKMFFHKIEMEKIAKETCLTERIIRRILKENDFYKKRERYYRFILNLNKEKTIKQLSIITGIKENILSKYRRKFGIKSSFVFVPKNKIITPSMELEFIEEYKNGKSCFEISSLFGFKTSKTVIDVLNKHCIKMRSPSDYTNYSRRYFKNINTVAKEYILGLLLSDGYVLRDYAGIGIQLSYVDGYILEKISKELGSSASVIGIKAKKNCNAKPMVRLSAYCPEMSVDLKEYGFIRNKTFCLKFPNNLNRLNHFVRGLIDGDGSIGFHSKNDFPWARLTTASKSFADSFCEAMRKEGFSFNISGDRIFNCYQVGGKGAILDFYKWIYCRKGKWYLERKYEKVQNKIY